jgi:two-component system, OmpR family, sensor histidine kinase VicK
LTVSSLHSIKGQGEVTRVFYGVETVMDIVIEFLNQTKNVVYACVDQTRPILALDILVLKKAFEDAKKRGVKLLYITEITKDNLSYCKQLTSIVDELRHLDGIKGNFYISESGYLAPATYHEEGKPASQIIYSNVNEIIDHQKYVFDSFWDRAIPADQKIGETGEGKITYATKIIENNPQGIVNQIAEMTANSNELATCLPSGGMQYSYNYFFEIKKKLLDKQKRGEHKGIRYVTSIDKENLHLIKIYLDAGIQVRHATNLPPMSFGVSDKQIAVTIEKMEGGRNVQSLLISGDSLYLKHFTSIFEELWKNAMNAYDRIKEIEEGTEADIKIIHNPSLALDLYLDTVSSAKQEILLIFPTTNAFIRHQRAGVFHLLRVIVQQQKIKVRILMPYNELTTQTIEDLKKSADRDVDIRSIKQVENAMATFLVVDKKFSLVMEIRDDSKETFDESIGLSVYSTSKAGVLSYVSIFENLWSQTELYEQLKIHDKMQKEFIDVAAHELRTPVQPILGLSEILQSQIKDDTQRSLVDVISRNAKRLQRLTEDILDVTKIESQSLNSKKENFNLNEIVMSVIAEYGANAKKYNIDVSLISKGDFIVQGDKGRLAQVLSNLVGNAIKFTKEGNIDISLEKTQDGKEVVLSVKDTGYGIHYDIMPRLFAKFATRSNTGTGLGLYISKNIIEAHGGRIWAENNSDGKGATFSFSLPTNQ